MTDPVLGLRAPAPRLTPLGAALFAAALAVTGGAVLMTIAALIP